MYTNSAIQDFHKTVGLTNAHITQKKTKTEGSLGPIGPNPVPFPADSIAFEACFDLLQGPYLELAR